MATTKPALASGDGLGTDRPAKRVAVDALAFAAPLAVGGIGGAITAPAIPTWYRHLDKPIWNPPDSLFAPVWTTLYLLMGFAIVLVRRANTPRRRRAETVFGLQLALNLAWSVAFFGRRDPAAGLAVIVLLWAAIAATMGEFWRARHVAAAILVPYLAWVTFATALNAEIWRLND
jgi:tryptophan-rich sensory protein